MSLLIKALNKAEEAQAQNAKTEQALAEKNKAKSALALDLELDVAPASKRKIETQAAVKNTTDLDTVLSLSPAASKLADDKLKANDIAKSAPAYTPTPTQPTANSVSAKNAANVFAAKGMEAKTDSSRLALIAGAGLIALLGMGLYFYQFVDNTPPVMLPPRPPEIVASQPAAPDTESNVAETIAMSESAPLAEPAPSQSVEPAIPVAIEPAQIQVADKRENAAKKRVKELNDNSDENMAAEEVLAADETVIVDNTDNVEAPAAVNPNKKMRKSKNNASIASDSASIQVSRSTAQSGVSPVLMSAYEAYNAGNDKEAIKLYKQVLQRDVRNVDALLGLGAIAARQGRMADANGWYGKVLELDPRNNIAQTAMLDSQSQGNEQGNETRLKSMLAKQPDDANLHVALGNLYAEQNQWPAAQQAYFDAYSINKTADNAYNLAVSLDQMGKPKLALPYYQLALSAGSNNIDKAALEARIAAIQ
jgi:tetratricopeptide (TPR) repeat protein